MSNIISFDNNKHSYFEFSNYYEQPLNLTITNNLTKKKENIIFNSIEQYYQSEKYNTNNKINQEYRKYIINTNTPKKAHLLGKQRKFIYPMTLNNTSKISLYSIIDKYKNKVKVRKDWNKIKTNILMKGLKEKFKDKKLKELLMKTNNKILVENSIGLWGMKNNKLGNLLMSLRNELKNK